VIVVSVETSTGAPPCVCFDAARNVDTHALTTDWTRERIADAPQSRMLEGGDLVTFEAVHFGVRQRLTAKIVDYRRPERFVDEMVRGPFRSLRHTHEFQATTGGTRMIDTLEIAAPLGVIGWVAERLFLAAYMRAFLARRNAALASYCSGAERTEG
jgi:ligand-binding SRPBCC domain-containing protein